MAGERSFLKQGTSKASLEAAWRDRLEDAEVLRSAGRWAMSIANGLYAVEILLKARICEHLDIDKLPQAFQIHDLEELLVCSGLSRRILDADAAGVRVSWNFIQEFALEANRLRYGDHSRLDRPRVDRFLNSLNDPTHGVVTWISTRT